MDKKRAIEIICCERTCVKRQGTPLCPRTLIPDGCKACELVQKDEDIVEAYNMAIDSLLKETEPDTEERNCKDCIHHIEGGCSTWNCEFERRPE